MRTSVKAFTLVEVLIVVVILGILAAVVVPKFASASGDARAASVESTVAGVRASIATFRTNAVIQGNPPYPTLTQLTDGTVLKVAIPMNSFNDMSAVQSVTRVQALARTVNTNAVGWNYFVDNNSNPPIAVFYANSDSQTTAADGAGGTLSANEF